MTGAADPMPDVLAPEMARLMAEVASEEGVAPDTTLMDPAEGRAEAARGNRRWNRELPEMASAADLLLPPDPALATPAVPLRVLVPPGARDGALVYVHGGGFAYCSPATHERCARLLALETRLPVLLPDYRLAPEDPFPAGLMDTVAALRGGPALAAAAGVRPGPLVVSGDSAGANLALAALLHEIRAGHPAGVAAAMLFYGVFDADFASASYRRFADGPGLTRDKMRRYWDWYLPDAAARSDGLASPARASDAEIAALPPLGLIAAGIDPLLSDTLALAARCAALGRTEQAVVVPGVTHGFLQMSLDLPQARDALGRAGEFIRGHIDAKITNGRT